MSINKKKILILGSGGHARVVADTIKNLDDYELVGFVDNEHRETIYKNYPVIGNDNQLEEFFRSGVTCAAMGIGYLGEGDLRQSIYQHLKNIGFEMPAIVDKTAVVAEDVIIAEGVYVGKLAVVNSGACLGIMSIINTSAIVEHNCTVGDFSHVAIGAATCGGAYIGDAAFVGAGAIVIQEKTIGNKAIVGAGSVVLGNVSDGEKVAGVPARSIRR